MVNGEAKKTKDSQKGKLLTISLMPHSVWFSVMVKIGDKQQQPSRSYVALQGRFTQQNEYFYLRATDV